MDKTTKLIFAPLIIVLLFSLTFCDELANGLSAGGQIVMYGRLNGERFGAGLDFIGDINGDGNQDIAVGAPGDFTYGADGGAVYIFFGPFDPSETVREAGIKIAGQAGTLFGSSIAGGFDFDSDGLSDFAVSSRKSIFGSSSNGDIFIFFGSSSSFVPSAEPIDAQGKADMIIQGADSVDGTLASRGFGERVGSIGDIDRDGVPDIGVSSPSSDHAGHEGAGALFVFLSGRSIERGKIITSALADYIFVGDEDGARFGESFSYALNLDGQGGSGAPFLDDLAVGAAGAGAGKGKSYAFLGPVTRFAPRIVLSSEADGAYQGDGGDDSFGASVSHLKDIDGDGCDEMAVSSSMGTESKVYVFWGRPGLAPKEEISLVIRGEHAGGNGDAVITSFLTGSAANISIGLPEGISGRDSNGLIMIFPPEQTALYPKNAPTEVDMLEAWKILYNPLRLGTGQGFATVMAGDADINDDGDQDLLVGAPDGDVNGEDSGYAVLYF